MITIWKTPIVATVEQVLKDLKLQLYGAGLLKEIKNTGSDLMCTCPFHAHGKEHNPWEEKKNWFISDKNIDCQ